MFATITVIKLKSSAVTMHVKTFTDRDSHQTYNKEFWTHHLYIVLNLSVIESPGSTADHTTLVGGHTFLLTGKWKCQILSVLPELPSFVIAATFFFFPFWQYRFCSAVWQRLPGFAQWKKLLSSHSSQNLWSYSATGLFCQGQAEQLLPSFPSCASHTASDKAKSKVKRVWKLTGKCLK